MNLVLNTEMKISESIINELERIGNLTNIDKLLSLNNKVINEIERRTDDLLLYQEELDKIEKSFKEYIDDMKNIEEYDNNEEILRNSLTSEEFAQKSYIIALLRMTTISRNIHKEEEKNLQKDLQKKINNLLNIISELEYIRLNLIDQMNFMY